MKVLFALAIMLSFFVTPADARAHRHHWHHYTHHAKVHKPHARHWHADRHLAPAVAPAEKIEPTAFWPRVTGNLVAVAERYIGGNPTGWAHVWCAHFLNVVVLPAAGYRGTGSPAAISFARWGSPSGPVRGAIAVLEHHVGIVMADHGKTVTLISGNYGHRVGIGEYPKGRILAYRAPT